MDLNFTEEQQMLRDTVRGLCARECPIAVVRAMEDDPIGYPASLWRQMAELGLLGLAVPEAHGGSAQSPLESMIVYEELGRALAPSPYFVAATLGAGVLTRAGTDAQKREWLPRIAAGEGILTPAWLEPKGGYGPAGVQLNASASGGTVKLNGTKRHVPFAKAATRLLVLARTGTGPTDVDLLLVDPNAPGVTLTQQKTMAGDTQYEVGFRDVAIAATERVGSPRGGWAVWNDVMHEGIVMLAAQAMGGAERALEITVDYAKTRTQFDKPLGAFQAIAH
jgi:alkylation response protein AidB-like acyl-CoA dehydrogenase